jgi:nucleotide-binding universal stress UspA family protein
MPTTRLAAFFRWLADFFHRLMGDSLRRGAQRATVHRLERRVHDFADGPPLSFEENPAMQANKILCPVDFSPCSQAAFGHAIELARGNQATMVLAHVLAPPPTYISGFAGYGALPPYEPEPDSRLEGIRVPDDTVDVKRVHLVGLEGETIVKYAEQTGCDLIVMGTHGYSGFTKFLLGSVADFVMRHAKCAVVVVRDRLSERERTDQDSTAAV